MFYFCTYLDSHYLIKGITLYRSLVRHARPFRLWILCFDDLAYEVLQELALAEVIPISLRDFEMGDEKLLQAKENRSRIEYYFTCTPSLLSYILRIHPGVDLITYLDADLFFFFNPSRIYEEAQNASVLIIEHRFTAHLKYKEIFGVYNVGFLSFRRDDAAGQCLLWWRDRCLEWCYDRAEDNRFADQKYLDDWPSRFLGVVVLRYKGANLAPWNIANYTLSLKRDEVFVDSDPLIFFHFHNLKQINNWLYDPNLSDYGLHLSGLLRRYIYRYYLRELEDTRRWISVLPRLSRFQISTSSIRGGDSTTAVNSSVFRRQARKLKNQLRIAKKFFQEDLLMVVGGKVV